MTHKAHSISWNLTGRCNLKCAHCYLDASTLRRDDGEEMETGRCLEVVDQIGAASPGALLILTGGEPLLRSDIFTIISHAAERGLTPVLGTNGTMIAKGTAEELRRAGLRGAGISIDSLEPQLHDPFRGVSGALEAAMKGMAELRRSGINLMVQTTVTSWNLEEIPRIIDFAQEERAIGINIFFLVCTGRGQGLTDISPAQYEEALSLILRKQREKGGSFLVRAKCAPQFNRLVHGDGQGPLSSMSHPGGCPAGTHYCRITPEGLVTPCPYIPTPAGDLRRDAFGDIWERAPLFAQLRHPARKGRCGRCEYSPVCGGCRARALAVGGDLMGEDPWCAHEPGSEGGQGAIRLRQGAYGMDASPTLRWNSEAMERLEGIPSFARGMVLKGVEKYAREKGLTEVDADVMAAAREHLSGAVGRMSAPGNNRVDDR